ncbi:MAG: O-antigen ligase family protein [Hyphomicrobiaceae bacterium]
MSLTLQTLAFLQFFIAIVGIGLVPKATVIALAVFVAVALGVMVAQRIPWRDWVHLAAPAWWLIALATLALASAVWSIDPSASLTKGALLSLVVTGTGVALASVRHIDPRLVAAAGLGIISGTISLVGVNAFELMTDQLLSRQVYTWFPALIVAPEKHVFVRDGVAVAVSEANSNRRIFLATLLLWPLVYVLWSSPPGVVRTMTGLALAASYTVLFLLTKHQTSQFAVVLSLVAFSIALLHRHIILIGLAAAWSASVLLVVPLALALHSAELHRAPWLFESARHRVVIWNNTAEATLDSPVLGIGAHATSTLNAQTRPPIRRTEAADPLEVLNLSEHAHNVYLQTWFELGVVGAALLLGLGLSVVLTLRTLSGPFLAFAAAQVTVVATSFAFAFGMWQEWYWSAIAISFVVLNLARVTSERGSPNSDLKRRSVPSAAR